MGLLYLEPPAKGLLSIKYLLRIDYLNKSYMKYLKKGPCNYKNLQMTFRMSLDIFDEVCTITFQDIPFVKRFWGVPPKSYGFGRHMDMSYEVSISQTANRGHLIC